MGEGDRVFDRKDKAAECCREAEFCLEVASRASIREDRERMLEMAQEWLVLALTMQMAAIRAAIPVRDHLLHV